MKRGEEQEDRTCQWFALCTQEAEVDVPHPILGTVPTCQYHADWIGATR